MGRGTTGNATEDDAAGEGVQEQTNSLDPESSADQLRAESSLQAWHTSVRPA